MKDWVSGFLAFVVGAVGPWVLAASPDGIPIVVEQGHLEIAADDKVSIIFPGEKEEKVALSNVRFSNTQSPQLERVGQGPATPFLKFGEATVDFPYEKHLLFARVGPEGQDTVRTLISVFFQHVRTSQGLKTERTVLAWRLERDDSPTSWKVNFEAFKSGLDISSALRNLGVSDSPADRPSNLLAVPSEGSLTQIYGYFPLSRRWVALCHFEDATPAVKLGYKHSALANFFAESPLPIFPEVELSEARVWYLPTGKLLIDHPQFKQSVTVPIRKLNAGSGLLSDEDDGSPKDQILLWGENPDFVLDHLRSTARPNQNWISIKTELFRALSDLADQNRAAPKVGSDIIMVHLPGSLTHLVSSTAETAVAEVITTIRDFEGERAHSFLYAQLRKGQFDDQRETLIAPFRHHLRSYSTEEKGGRAYWILDLSRWWPAANDDSIQEILPLLKDAHWENVEGRVLVVFLVLPVSRQNGLRKLEAFDVEGEQFTNSANSSEDDSPLVQIHHFDLSARVPDALYFELIAELLRKGGMTTDLATLNALVRKLRDNGVEIFGDDIEVNVSRLLKILKSFGLTEFGDRQQVFIPTIVSKFQSLSGVLNNLPDPRELIRALWFLTDKISASADRPVISKPLHGLDRIIGEIGRTIAGWLPFSSERPLVIPILGPKGNGKTSLVEALPIAIGDPAWVAIETVNVGNKPGLEDGSNVLRTPEERVRAVINDAIEKLRLSGARVPILLIDEIDKCPDAIRPFLSSSTGKDPAQTRILDLNGIVVFLLGNVNEQHRAISRIERMDPDDSADWAAIGEAFVSMFDAHLQSNPDLKTLLPALVSRFVSAFYVRKLANQDSLMQESYIRELLQPLATRHQVPRFVVGSEAMAYLKRLYTAGSHGNYRGVDIKISTAFDIAFAHYRLGGQTPSTQAPLYVSVEKLTDGREHLALFPLGSSREALIRDADDTYRNILETTSKVIQAEWTAPRWLDNPAYAFR